MTRLEIERNHYWERNPVEFADELYQWIGEHIKSRIYHHTSYIFYIEDKDEATLFKLRWC